MTPQASRAEQLRLTGRVRRIEQVLFALRGRRDTDDDGGRAGRPELDQAITEFVELLNDDKRRMATVVRHLVPLATAGPPELVARARNS